MTNTLDGFVRTSALVAADCLGFGHAARTDPAALEWKDLCRIPGATDRRFRHPLTACLARAIACVTAPDSAAMTRLTAVARTPTPPLPIAQPHAMVNVCFFLEEAFWLFSDTGGREAAVTVLRLSYPPQMRDWMHAASDVFATSVTSTSMRAFWERVSEEFVRFKVRMMVASAMIANSTASHILLVRHQHGGRRDTWMLPGGKCYLHANETADECVFREISEELRFTQADLELVDSRWTSESRRRYCVFLMRLQNAERVPVPDPTEIREWGWISIDDIASRAVQCSSLVYDAVGWWAATAT